MNINFKFPENFLWGASSSGPQSEGAAKLGGKGESIWDYWYSINPELFFENVGPNDTSTFYANYKDDIKLMKKIGLNSFQTSIQWSRMMPDKTGKINFEAVKFYNKVIDELINSGILPIINLYQSDIPMWAQKIGGWESRNVVDYYVQFAKACFRLFGDRVKFWTTFNDPLATCEKSYLGDDQYPCVVDGLRATRVAYHEMLASAIAIKEYRKMEISSDGSIGITLNITPSYPKDFRSKNIEAANIQDLFYNRSYLDASVFGEFPSELIDILKENKALPDCEKRDLEIIKENTVDYLGINYFFPRRVQARDEKLKSDVFLPEKYFETYNWEMSKINKYSGWEIYEDGLYDICDCIMKNYGNIPFFIAGNGLGVEGEEQFMNEKGQIQDDYRIDFLKDHLKKLHLGIMAGSNCFGYHCWTLIDNWCWKDAYKNRYGLIHLDTKTQKRKIKKSGDWYKKLTNNNGFN